MVAVARGANRSMVFSAVRGAGLIGLFVIVGIVLLQVVDDGGSGPSGRGGGGTPDTEGPDETTATTPAGRDPSEVRVLVLNAGQAAGAAQNKANQLRTAGYNTLPASNTLPRTGVAVQCRADFDNDAAALAFAVGEGTMVEPFPDEPPPGSDDADCLVLLGQV
jgi:hypothetical protein